MMVRLDYLSTLQWWESNMHSIETTAQILNFDLFPGLAIHRTTCPRDAGQRAELAGGQAITAVNSGYCSVPRQPFCFPLSVQYAINGTSCSTLYYKIGFLLDDCAQP